jgi:hypothetical protein
LANNVGRDEIIAPNEPIVEQGLDPYASNEFLSVQSALLITLSAWYEDRRLDSERKVGRYIVCVGLAVTEHMRSVVPLHRHHVVTKRGEVRTSGALIRRILARYGIHRNYSSSGGRTTTKALEAAEDLVSRITNGIGGSQFNESERNRLSDALQGWLIEKVEEYFVAHPLPMLIGKTLPPSQLIAAALDSARTPEAVAQQLVRAKLTLRYQKTIAVENRFVTTADLQPGRNGDFIVGTTVFHVTVVPTSEVIEKCRENVRNGYRAKLLVRESVLQAARQLVSIAELERQVGVASIESFVGQNVEELGEFDQSKITDTLIDLFAEYNRRVAEAELDRSLLLDLPEFLRSRQ